MRCLVVLMLMIVSLLLLTCAPPPPGPIEIKQWLSITISQPAPANQPLSIIVKATNHYSDRALYVETTIQQRRNWGILTRLLPWLRLEWEQVYEYPSFRVDSLNSVVEDFKDESVYTPKQEGNYRAQARFYNGTGKTIVQTKVLFTVTKAVTK